MTGDDDLPSFAKPPRPGPGRAVAITSATLLLALALGLAAGRLWTSGRRPAVEPGAGRPAGAAPPGSDSPSVLAVEAIQRIGAFAQALDAYRRDRGSLPAGAWVDAYAELSGKFLAPGRLPRRDPWNQAIRYVTSSDRQVFLLLSPGDDGIYQVDDAALSAMLARRCRVEKQAYGAGFGTDLICCDGLFVSAPDVEGAASPKR